MDGWMVDLPDLREITCCPRCVSDLSFDGDSVRCRNGACPYSVDGFPQSFGQPVLIDFENSVFARSAYVSGSGRVQTRDDTGRGWRVRFRRLISGPNPIAEAKIADLLAMLAGGPVAPTVLVVGGGAIGDGAQGLYRDRRVRVVGTDVYASPNTRLVADGHRLPFKDGVFDAVVIQAVLEHVLEPQAVVDQIHRVLKPGGLVYSETPFMQQVHEGAYDFARFTQSGHRWLFKRFEQIDAGVVQGAGVALIWSIRYFLRALGAGDKWARLASVPFFWLRYADRLARPRQNADAASGTYFLGRRSERALSPRDMVSYYDGR